MAFHLVISGVDKRSGTYHAVFVDEAFSFAGDYGFVLPEQIKSMVAVGRALPLNFSLDRNGKILQNCGDFSRFSQRGSAVVLAEIKSTAGRTLGYRLLSCANNACVNLKTEEILSHEAAMPDGEHFLQNGIVRNKTVNCYPLKPFPVLTVDIGKKPVKKPAERPAVPPVPKRSPHTKKALSRSDFTKEQLKEIHACQNAGIDAMFLANPELSPEQMRVLWVAKSKGAIAESFSDPKFSVDSMKFYADRLMDKQTVAECGDMLAHPELGVGELSELYLCVCQGVPYSEYIGKSASDINVSRETAVSEYWGGAKMFEVDYIEKAYRAAAKLKGMT